MFARRRSGFRGFALLVSLLTSSTAYAADDWYAVTSDNFTIYSDWPAALAERVIKRFEIFRDSALRVLGLPDEPEKQPLLIMIYANPRELGRMRPDNVTGVYYDSIEGPRMLMRGDLLAGLAIGTLYHDYVHYLLHHRSQLNYPRWYDEGIATVIMMTQITDSTLVGEAPPWINYKWGSRPTVKSIITDSADDREHFNATAWLLAHYVSLDNRTRREQTTEYLRRYDAGDDPVAAFEASYGITTVAMDAELAEYASRETLTGRTAPTKPYSGSLSTRTLAREEALLLLADIALEIDELKAAHRYLDQADDIGADSPFRARLNASRAIAYIHDRNVAKGEPFMRPLLEQANEDPEVLADIAQYALAKFVQIKLGEWKGDAAVELERAIEYGVRAVAADPENLEAHYYLGESYEAAGQLQNATDALLRAYDLSPSPRLNLALARVLINGSQPKLASTLLSRMVSASHDEEWRSSVREIVADLEDGKLSRDYAVLTPPWVALPDD